MINDEGGAGSRPDRAGLLGQEVVRLVRASHAIRGQIHARQGEGLEWAGYMLLLQLCKEGPQRSSALAANACIDPSTVSRQVSQLVSLGLVERRADPDDGRASLLAATDQGQARHQAVHDRRDRAFSHLLDGWSDDDVRLLTDLLHRLNESFLQHRGSMLDAIAGGADATTGSDPTSASEESA